MLDEVETVKIVAVAVVDGKLLHHEVVVSPPKQTYVCAYREVGERFPSQSYKGLVETAFSLVVCGIANHVSGYVVAIHIFACGLVIVAYSAVWLKTE